MTTNSDTHPQGTRIDQATPLEDPDACGFTPAQAVAMLELGAQDALESTVKTSKTADRFGDNWRQIRFLNVLF